MDHVLHMILDFDSVQFRSATQSCLTLCDPINHSRPGFPVHHQLPELTQTHVYQVDEAIQPSHPLLSPSPLIFNLSQHQVFSNESTLRMRWPKYWSFSFSISPSNEHPGLISFRIDWLYLLAVQGSLKSLLQHHSSKASILRRSAVFTVQLSHPYMTTGKTIALTRWTFKTHKQNSDDHIHQYAYIKLVAGLPWWLRELQWLRICLPIQGTQLRSLVQEDLRSQLSPRVTTTEPALFSPCFATREATLMRSLSTTTREESPVVATRQSTRSETETQSNQKEIDFLKLVANIFMSYLYYGYTCVSSVLQF